MMKWALLNAMLILVAAAEAADESTADDLPVLQPGLWNYEHTLGSPGTSKRPVESVQQCTNPTKDIQAKRESLIAEGCHFSPVVRRQRHYSYEAVCTNKQGIIIHTRSEVVVINSNEYRVMTEAHDGNQIEQSMVIAHRLGECAK